jgi:hypothetical protein
MKTNLIVRLIITTSAVLCAVVGIAATNESPRVSAYTPGNYDAPPSDPRRPAAQSFMRQKLAYSQGVLEGLALEKFDVVSKSAMQMRNMTQTNLWFSLKNSDYLRHTTNYQRGIDTLLAAALEKNLDAATEAYARVAKSCVECHRVVRLEQRRKGILKEK